MIERQFILPIASMLIGLLLWLVFFVARRFSTTAKAWPERAEVSVAAASAVLIVLSAFT